MIVTKGIKLGKVCVVKGVVTNIEELIDAVDVNAITVDDDVNITHSHRRIKYKNDIYYIFEHESDGEQRTRIYKLLPNVVDDDVFKWTERTIRTNVRNQWCSVDCGNFTFNILYYTESGECKIAVQWNRNNIGTIRLNDQTVDNQVIKEAIEKYKKNFAEAAKASSKDKLEPRSPFSLTRGRKF